MKQLLSAIALWALATLNALAAPDITWVETVHDYGAIDEDSGPVTCKLRFVNRGPYEVAIVSARASCGCTTPRFSYDPVAPGDTGIVEVTYDPVGRPGRFSKKVKITTADPQGDQLSSTLEVRGVVVGASNTLRSRYPIEAGPARLRTATLAFGEVKNDSQKSTYLDVYNTSAQTIYPSIVNAPDYLRVTASAPAVPPAEQATFVVTFIGAKAPDFGIVTDSLQFVANPGEQPVSIDVVAIVKENFDRLTPAALAKAPVSAMTESVDFGTLSREGSEATRTFEITNRGDNPLTIRRIYTTDPGVSVSFTPAKVKKHKKAIVSVTVKPGDLPSELLNARLQVITNDPINPVKAVRVVGEVK